MEDWAAAAVVCEGGGGGGEAFGEETGAPVCDGEEDCGGHDWERGSDRPLYAEEICAMKEVMHKGLAL